MSALSSTERALLRLWDAADGVPARGTLATALNVSVQRVKALLEGLIAKGALDADEVGPLQLVKGERIHGHGLTPREQEIMDLSDAGLSAEAIGRELRIDLGYIRATIRNYAFASCWDNSRKFEAAARAGDRRYQAALAATGIRYA